MTFEEAAGIMIGGSGGSVAEPPKPELITYEDVNTSAGMITEHYNVGKDSEYTKKIGILFSNKGSVNEQISALNFLDKNGNVEHYVSFSGFYVG